MEQNAKVLETTEVPTVKEVRKFGIRDKIGSAF